MLFQDRLKNISSLIDAFDITNFVRLDSSGRYHFKGFQYFEFVYGGGYEYTTDINNIKYCGRLYDPDLFEAFEELDVYLTSNILPSGQLDLDEDQVVVEPPQQSNGLFCSCSNPDLVESQAMGEKFDYCRGCKKEYSQKTKKKDSGDFNGYWF